MKEKKPRVPVVALDFGYAATITGMRANDDGSLTFFGPDGGQLLCVEQQRQLPDVRVEPEASRTRAGRLARRTRETLLGNSVEVRDAEAVRIARARGRPRWTGRTGCTTTRHIDA